MIRILKMEFRRLFKTGCFYAFPAVLAITVLTEWISTSSGEKLGEMDIVDVFGAVFEVVLLMTIAVSGVLSVFLWAQEYKKGYIKNIANTVSGRHIITVARLIVGAFIMIINTVFTFLTVLCIASIEHTGIVSKHPELVMDNVSQLLLMCLSGIAVIAFVLMLFEIFRSSALGYTMILMICFNFLEGILCNIVALINPNWEIGRHLLISQFNYINGIPVFNASGEITLQAPDPMWTFWLRTGIYLIVFLVAASIVSKKKDAV